MTNDETLLECIQESGYYQLKDVNIDDLPNDKRISIILAGEILALRPELKKPDSDIVYVKKIILENGQTSYGLPSKSLSEQLRADPFSDTSIWTFSLKDEKFLKKIYQGTGTIWERIK